MNSRADTKGTTTNVRTRLLPPIRVTLVSLIINPVFLITTELAVYTTLLQTVLKMTISTIRMVTIPYEVCIDTLDTCFKPIPTFPSFPLSFVS